MPLFGGIKVLSFADAMTNYFQGVSSHAVKALSKTLHSNGVRTAIAEEGYIDIDYSASYYLQRARSFTPVERATTRVHFFSRRLRTQPLYDSSPEFAHALSKPSVYLGYSVVRPGNPPTLGRTFIKPPHEVGGSTAFFPTRASIPANLCGISLKVEACPYLSQDQLVSACATASLWMASNPLISKIRGVSEYSTADITRLAMALDRSFTPAIGGRGLRFDEMERVLLIMGYDPNLWQYPNPDTLIETCHIYVESGICPVLLISLPQGRHAVTIVGYTMNTKIRRMLSNQDVPAIYSSTEFVPNLVLHDDQMGMYLQATIRKITQTDIPSNDKDALNCKAAIEIHHGHEVSVGCCMGLIVPFPSRVMLTGDGAMAQAVGRVRYWQSRGWLPKKDLVLRAFLVRSNLYKESLVQQRLDMPHLLTQVYRSLPMPRYIWVVEYGYLDDWRGSDINQLRIRGELILDSTLASNAWIAPLSVHVPGWVDAREIISTDKDPDRYQLLDDSQGYRVFDLQLSRP